MTKYKRIPVVKSRIVAHRAKRHPRRTLLGLIIFGLVIMLFYVWLKVQINLLLAENRMLEVEHRHYMVENEKLRGEVTRLSSFARIHKIAQEDLDMIFIAQEDIHEIPNE
ncbi:MAG: hypothetical protein ACE5HX_11815 [bacterium]